MVVSQCSMSQDRTASEPWIARVGWSRGVVVPLFFLAAILATAMLSWHFVPLAIDDSLISYRYSDRLLHGKGLTWNDGEFVEGYSNLLWVLLVALGGLLQPNLVMVGWLLGFLSTVATLASIPWAFGRGANASTTAVVMGLLIMACSQAFSFWAVAGMETALVSALLSWALATAYPRPDARSAPAEWVAALLFGLISITRPDGILFGICTAIGEFIRSGFTRNVVRKIVTLVAIPIAFLSCQIVFRLSYYGTIVPNTAYGKLVFNFERVLGGAYYVGRGAWVNSVLIATVVIATLMLRRHRGWEALRQNALFIVPGVVWLIYVSAIGGDWFPFERHWQPAFICLVFCMCGLIGMLSPIKPQVGVPVAMCLILLHITTQVTINPYAEQYSERARTRFDEVLQREVRKVDPSGRAERELLSHKVLSRAEYLQAYHYEHHRCAAVGGLLNTAFINDQPLVAVNTAGCLPYFSRLPALDMLGLTDYHIAHHLPADMGHGLLAHELGDGAYVLSRHPDLIVFCGNGMFLGVVVPCHRGDREIAASPEFHKYYRLVFYRKDAFEMPMWTRIEQGRLGIRRTDDTLYIPGFLLATTPTARAELDSGGRLVAKLLDTGDAVLEDIEFPAGTWDVSTQTDGDAHLTLASVPAAGSSALKPDTVHITSIGGVRSFKISGAQGSIYAIVARRVSMERPAQ